MDAPTKSIVDFVRSSDYSSLSPACVHGIVRNLLDAIGCAAAGFDGEGAVITRRLAAATGGDFAASAFGLPNLPQAEFAILTNAAAVRDRDWHDGGLDAGHPSDASPAMIAVAEATNSSIHDLIGALYISYEVVGALGKDGQFNDKGLRTLIITLGTVAGTGKLLGLTDDQLANAVAMSMVSSLPLPIDQLVRQSHWKSIGASHASMIATLVARLAREGLTGPPHVFDGDKAVWETVTDRFDLDNLGVPIEGKTVPERVSHKFFPCSTESQGPLALMLDLREKITPDQIESMSVMVTDVSWLLGAGERTPDNRRWDPTTKDVANHSLPYLLAKTLVDGPITTSSFTPEAVRDPALRPLMQKISVHENPEFTARRRSTHEENAVIDITLTDGSTVRRESRHPRGHRANPMSDEELTHKFDGSMAKVLPAAAHGELRDRLWNLPDEHDLGAITALFRQFTNTP
jgi:2-methylcitrate dehydratase